MNPSTSRNDGRLDNVQSTGVTEWKEDVFVFRWNAKNFKEHLNNKDLKKKKVKLDSPVFTFEEKNNERQLVVYKKKCYLDAALYCTKKWNPLPKLEWHLSLKSYTKKKNILSTKKDTFLSVYLHSDNYKTPIRTTFQFDLLDSEEKSWTKACCDHEYVSPGGWGWPKYVNIRDLLDPKNKLLEDDALKLQCRIVMKRIVERQLSPPQAGTTEAHDLTQKFSIISDFSSMFTSSIFGDVLIKTKGCTFKAHKAVLSCRSPVFLAMFHSQMLESIQNVVEIVDFGDDIVKWMLEFIYGVKISQKILTENAVKLIQIADKYDIPGLKDLVEEVLVSNLSVKTVVDTLILADMNSVPNLKARAFNFINMNKEAVTESWEFKKLLNYDHNPSIFKELFTNK